ncbi:hypothetical protein [Xanthomonas sp. XNM01]|uniref:SPOR domain-containing protein n=1 Tax=Xanthomonas sp. XNM01 TaxID=2769289 RepID=UPI001783C82E|nr:hypothetical protein [Xanthomonas sp. XNM01]MBD9367109.1 hypothetical protein [Xanthomonas sp. XNM01]
MPFGDFGMTTDELARRLHAAGCNPALYAVGDTSQASDALCLAHRHGRWRIFFSERGRDAPPIASFHDEAVACAAFRDRIMLLRHDHCVGIFASPARAQALQAQLRGAGVASWTDRVPLAGVDDPRHRVFVTGAAIFDATALPGVVPLTDATGPAASVQASNDPPPA